MKPLVIIFLIFISMLCKSALAQEQQLVVPYTIADRDRAILTEVKLSSLETNMNIRFESQQRDLNDIKTLFYWGFGILITLFIFMLGYTIWDRRTAMQPALI